MAIHMELERRLASFKNTEAVVVFQSGFAANAGTVAAVLTKDDVVVSDELNHASIIDGCRLEPGGDQGVSRTRTSTRRGKRASRAAGDAAQAAHYRRRVQHGRRPRRAAGVVRAGGGVRLHHDGRRCACERRVRQERPRHDRPLRHARPRRHPGGHAVESHRRARRLRRRQPRADRVPVPPRAAVPVLDVASTRGRRRVPRGDRRPRSRSRRSSSGCGRTRASSRRACRRWGSTPA